MNDVVNKKFSPEEVVNIAASKLEIISQLTSRMALATYTPNGDKDSPMHTELNNQDLSELVVAGGCISSILRKEISNDYDVFILNSKRGILNDLIENKSGSWTVRFVAGNDENQTYFDNPRIIMTALNSISRVQYILTDYATRSDLIADFDFLHCTASYTPADDRLYISHEAYDAIMNKKLIRHNKKRHVKKYREQKLMNAGWRSIADSLLDDTKTGIVWAKSGWEKQFVPMSLDEKKTFMTEMDELIDNIVNNTDPYLQTR